MAQYTPMIQQYLQVKAEAQDAFLFSGWATFMKCFLKMPLMRRVNLKSR